METGTSKFDESLINSHLSFRPLLDALKKNLAAENPGMTKLYGRVVKQMESHPELLTTITDLSVLKKHADLIEELLASVFPPTSFNNLYAVALPFKFQTVYTSKLFSELFLKPGSNEINMSNDLVEENFNREKLQFAYGMILKKYCGYNNPDTTSSIYPYTDSQSGLTRFMEMQRDARFIDVNPVSEMPQLPEDIVHPSTKRIMTMEELMELVPIEQFVFEGISVIHAVDVTQQEVISQIKNSLLNMNAFSDASVYTELESHIQSLIDLNDVKIGITPFFKVNGHYIYSDLHNNNSLLFKHFHSINDKDDISDCCKLLFRDHNRPVVFSSLDEQSLTEVEYLQYYYKEGNRSLIICPLKLHDELIGMLEIVSNIPDKLKHAHINKLEPAIHLFTLALEKSMEGLDNQIDKIIKEKFTAVQPVVEWKFTEVALNYIVNRHQQQDDVKMEKIFFPDVYPLYAAIDVRNSSTERSLAIQRDLIDQLQMARKVLKKAQNEMPFPLLQEIEFNIDKYIASASNVLLSDEEINIHDFLHTEVVSIFNHLHGSQPSVKKDVEQYFAALDPQIKMIYHHRKEFEQSISRINDTLAHFIDKEQAAAQKVFPHYFERYVTDGVEFNIYMGQTISPRYKFDEIYLRNMRMWQLTLLAKAAKITHHLEQHLSYPLRTTQLILAHSQPLSISFRTEEKKFDVDGAYNVRYEIVKKRIDKVHIKDTNERLTQPGKIAIVYSQAKDASEYLEYLEFLQNQKLLKPGVEQFELEDLQGVVGLKALRADVNFDHDAKHETAADSSSTASKHLMGNEFK